MKFWQLIVYGNFKIRQNSVPVSLNVLFISPPCITRYVPLFHRDIVSATPGALYICIGVVPPRCPLMRYVPRSAGDLRSMFTGLHPQATSLFPLVSTFTRYTVFILLFVQVVCDIGALT